MKLLSLILSALAVLLFLYSLLGLLVYSGNWFVSREDLGLTARDTGRELALSFVFTLLLAAVARALHRAAGDRN